MGESRNVFVFLENGFGIESSLEGEASLSRDGFRESIIRLPSGSKSTMGLKN
jgi:hypothetical protein